MKRLIVYFLFVFVVTTKAQTIAKTKYDQMLWGGYYNTININDKWKIVSDIQIRTKDWTKHWSQGLIRTGLSRKLNEKFTLTIGVAHFRYFITDALTRGEWRPWEELAIQDQWKNWKITHRVRVEQRFNQNVIKSEPTNEYVFNYRFRYKLEVQRSLWQKDD